jgi:hypothetical protein
MLFADILDCMLVLNLLEMIGARECENIGWEFSKTALGRSSSVVSTHSRPAVASWDEVNICCRGSVDGSVDIDRRPVKSCNYLLSHFYLGRRDD